MPQLLLEFRSLGDVALASSTSVRPRHPCFAMLAALTFAACAGSDDTAESASIRAHGSAAALEAPGEPDVTVTRAADDATSEGTSDGAASTFSKYLALGDSFSASVEEDLPSLATCEARSKWAWPEVLFADEIEAKNASAAFTFRACSGATTADLAGQYPSPSDPFKGADTLITVTVGGNDVKVSSEILNCLTTDCVARGPEINRKIDEVAAPNLRAAFLNLRKTFPSAKIVAVGYPLLVEDGENACYEGQLTKPEATMIRSAITHMNKVIGDAAADAKISAVVAEVVSAFVGKEACSTEPYIGPATLHPTEIGHRAYAAVVGRAIASLVGTGKTDVGRTVASTPASNGSGSTAASTPGTSSGSDGASSKGGTAGGNNGKETNESDIPDEGNSSDEDADGSGAQDDADTADSDGDGDQDVADDDSDGEDGQDDADTADSDGDGDQDVAEDDSDGDDGQDDADTADSDGDGDQDVAEDDSDGDDGQDVG
jgi:lysophospholipase L1-like esterase